MSDRFKGLKKLSTEPAARILAAAHVKLKSKITAPASAQVPAVLAELDAIPGVEARIETMRLLGLALPAREAVWWACLAARDYLGPKAKATKCLETAEAWVYKPGDDTREAAIRVMELAEPGDDTVFCAMAVAYCDGTLGTGEMSQIPAPPGGTGSAAFTMNVSTLDGPEKVTDVEAHFAHLIDRALDIARGGNGQIEKPAKKESA